MSRVVVSSKRNFLLLPRGLDVCRLLRRSVVRVRKPRVCEFCGRHICKGECALKTEYAESNGHDSREYIRTEFDCCHVHSHRH